MKGRNFLTVLGILLCANSAIAAQTISYSYDAFGRVTVVARSGTVNNGVSASYAYDKADNRANVAVTGSSNPALLVNPESTEPPVLEDEPPSDE